MKINVIKNIRYLIWVNSLNIYICIVYIYIYIYIYIYLYLYCEICIFLDKRKLVFCCECI